MEKVDVFATVERERASFLAQESHSLGLPSLFYGSLRAPAVFEIVVGRPMHNADIQPVALPNHELARIIAGDGFPGIFPTQEDTLLDCLLIRDLSAEEALRVAWYEWDEYKLGRFTLSDGQQAQAFVPDVEAIHRLHGSIDFQPWSFEDWRDQHLQDAIPNAQQWMAEMPDVTRHLAAAE
jgi:hypothetical protein